MGTKSCMVPGPHPHFRKWQLALIACMLFAMGIGNWFRLRAAPRSQADGGTTSFALDLHGQLKGAQGNLFFSPYSISSCLAMTYAGARGETEKQMAHVLHFGGDQSQVHAGFGDLQRQLAIVGAREGIELSVANALLELDPQAGVK